MNSSSLFSTKQLERIRNRPTRAAAYEFLASSTSEKNDSVPTITKWIDWKTLPQRFDRLCQSIEQWVSCYHVLCFIFCFVGRLLEEDREIFRQLL